MPSLHGLIKPPTGKNIIGQLTEDLHPETTQINIAGTSLVNASKTFFLRAGDYFIAEYVDDTTYTVVYPRPQRFLVVEFTEDLEPDTRFTAQYGPFTLPFYHPHIAVGLAGRYVCQWTPDEYLIDNPYVLENYPDG